MSFWKTFIDILASNGKLVDSKSRFDPDDVKIAKVLSDTNVGIYNVHGTPTLVKTLVVCTNGSKCIDALIMGNRIIVTLSDSSKMIYDVNTCEFIGKA